MSAPNLSKDVTDSEEPLSDAPQEKRSRSQSRRSRRRRQQAQNPKSKPMPSVQESSTEAAASNDSASAGANDGAMQPFEHIGPDSTSMDGPVTYARAKRGEIPMRPGKARQALATGNPDGAVGGAQQSSGGEKKSAMMDQDGLKLRLELNLDIEIELKAKITGDLTLALLS